MTDKYDVDAVVDELAASANVQWDSHEDAEHWKECMRDALNESYQRGVNDTHRAFVQSSGQTLSDLPPPEVTFHIEVEGSGIQLRGNVSAHNPETDAEVEKTVLRRLCAGDVWAWADVTVIASVDGYEGRAYLGACNYESEEDFVSSDYYADMKEEAYAELIADMKQKAYGELIANAKPTIELLNRMPSTLSGK